MRNLFLLAGSAALAVAAPALAEKGGKGGGHGGGGGKPAKVEHGGGHGGGKGDRANKPQRAERHAERAERRVERRAERQVERRAFREDRRVERRAERRDERRGDFRRDLRRAQIEGRDWRRMPDFRPGEPRFTGFDRGCPPGLAKKGNGCLPPGQAKKLFGVGQRLRPEYFEGYRLPAAYQSFYHDTPEYYYRYDDEGYIYRADRGSDLISAIIPLFGGGFGIGQPLPSGYDVYNLPTQYRDNWYDDEDSLYRYGDNAIYRVDSQSGLIEGIVALLAGDLNVGQPLPDGYDAYNLPYDYRDEYADNDDYLYRYADGNIYQVDAETQLVQAIVEMLA